jgi:hypothetical protein
MTHGIRHEEMQFGDAFLNPQKHVALFVQWEGQPNGNAIVWEESDYGKPALQTPWTPAYYKDFLSVRYNKIVPSPLPPH